MNSFRLNFVSKSVIMNPVPLITSGHYDKGTKYKTVPTTYLPGVLKVKIILGELGKAKNYKRLKKKFKARNSNHGNGVGRWSLELYHERLNLLGSDTILENLTKG